MKYIHPKRYFIAFRCLYQNYRFVVYKLLFGFDAANNYLKRCDKSCLIGVLKKHGATIGKNCDIETGLTFHNCQDYSNLIIGDNCHIGKNCFFDLRDKIIIGDNVVVSMLCTFITHIDMSKSDLSKTFPADQSKITIKDNCYIGSGSTVLKGVILNQNCFVGAKALVNTDVPENTLVGGVPAKIIKNSLLSDKK